ncbi:major facilitator superfamily domain-containing protein [Elsinoe ampelina]|uniref:Major facilitator superfamily domain-containing protein n=1 Tax=Elsinoe ampelina TaxID=302913 RepID=A0A6A6GFQ8_9PEZI|nr:major facilitator superfamily domain-containing protein [Elsinoe ampelina]
MEQSPAKTQTTELILQDIDPKLEKALVRKLDSAIIPVVMLLYTLSFLDRVNIGNARLYGLEEDLNLSATQYQTAVSILFVTYIIFELPSNLVIKHYVRPSRWISFITTAWGIVATFTGLTQNYGGLIACRLLLGALESGLFPGLAIYLTTFYTKRELALRVGYLFVSAAVAGACGGLLAYAIGFLDGTASLRGWRWIMILEGIPTVLLGVSCWWLLADDPETAFFLSAEQKKMMLARRAAQPGQTDTFEWKDARKGLRDWKIYVFSAGQFCADTMLYGYSTFLPTIIRGINPGASTALVQVLTIPCYATGAITYLLVAWVSDQRQQRGLYTCVLGLFSVLGYALLMSPVGSNVQYAGCFLVALGLYVLVGLPLAWLPSNNPRYGKRTTATGLQLTIGNTSGIMAGFLYPPREGPRFLRGHGVTVGVVAVAVGIYAGMSVWFVRENKKRARGDRDARTEGMTEEEAWELGDENPRYVFTT